MVKLAVHYFSELLALAQDPELDFAYVKIGDWLEEAAYEALAGSLHKRFLYHARSLVRESLAETRELIAHLEGWQQRTGCAWLSAHLDYYTDSQVDAILHVGSQGYGYDVEQSFARICEAAKTVAAQLPVPLLLENVPNWPWPGEVDVGVRPDFICRVLDQTGCDLLLDMAHARIAAAALECDAQDYLQQLSLGRVVEIHVSGPRYESGAWWDCHEALQDEDFALLEWLLQRTQPQVVTLEYWKHPARVRDQVLRLKPLLDAANDRRADDGAS
jgi:uncharacterized protein (UPF0276 family)